MTVMTFHPRQRDRAPRPLRQECAIPGRYRVRRAAATVARVFARPQGFPPRVLRRRHQRLGNRRQAKLVAKIDDQQAGLSPAWPKNLSKSASLPSWRRAAARHHARGKRRLVVAASADRDAGRRFRHARRARRNRASTARSCRDKRDRAPRPAFQAVASEGNWLKNLARPRATAAASSP